MLKTNVLHDTDYRTTLYKCDLKYENDPIITLADQIYLTI